MILKKKIHRKSAENAKLRKRGIGGNGIDP
jgi:hypothetical protein